MAERCPEPQDCRYRGTPECIVTTHHLWFSKRNYKTVIEKAFRELPENKESLPRCQHEALHRTTEAPEKPPLDNMIDAIECSEQDITANVLNKINLVRRKNEAHEDATIGQPVIFWENVDE